MKAVIYLLVFIIRIEIISGKYEKRDILCDGIQTICTLADVDYVRDYFIKAR